MISSINNISNRVVFKQQKQSEVKNSQEPRVILTEDARHEFGISDKPNLLVIGALIFSPIIAACFGGYKCYNAIISGSKKLAGAIRHLNIKH